MTGFDELYERVPCGLISATPDGVITLVNETFLSWTGYTREQLIGRSFVTLLDAGGRIFYETRYLPVLRLSGAVREVALTMRRADGSILSILINSVSDEAAAGGAVHSAVFDATERNDYERQLLQARRAAETSETRIRMLQNASMAFGSCESEEDLAEALAACAKESSEAIATAVMLNDDIGGLHLRGGEHPAGLTPALSEKLERETVARAQGVTIAVTDVAADATPFEALVKDALDAARLEAVTAIPVVDGGHVIGTVTSYFSRARRFDEAFDELQRALARQAAQTLIRIRLQKRLEAIANYDALTGLANRNLLRVRLAETISTSARTGCPMAMIFVDLDGFKAINDELDHSIGDAVLQTVAARLRSAVRRDDLVGRTGGDEFLVVCDGTDEAAASIVAERIREAVKEPIVAEASEVTVTASIGVVVHRPEPGGLLDGRDLYRRADAAMYESKNRGKDYVTVATF
ncbi:diguanylate cyclase domain-containing protein [Leifsonia sp. NPDC058248]|uniref:sensor domain-containing protein n=1 Tax=Leifsonia sp. NPDC058248 TaxID=3346402 RepID=UPI0036DF8C36